MFHEVPFTGLRENRIYILPPNAFFYGKSPNWFLGSCGLTVKASKMRIAYKAFSMKNTYYVADFTVIGQMVSGVCTAIHIYKPLYIYKHD